MAKIIGGVATTHVPSIGKAIADKKYDDPYWKPFFSGFDYVHQWLAREKPDIAVFFYNDHGLNFFLDKLPTFAVGAARSTATRMKAGAFRFRVLRSEIRPSHGT